MTETMTAEDIQAINDILAKYKITKWYPMYWSDDAHPFVPVLVPMKPDGNVSAFLVESAPDPEISQPKWNPMKSRWEELDHESQAKQLADIKDKQLDINARLDQFKKESVANDTANAKTQESLDEIKANQAQLTQLITQLMTQPTKKDGDQ